MPDAYENTSIKNRALTLTVKTPSVCPHCLGKKTTNNHYETIIKSSKIHL